MYEDPTAACPGHSAFSPVTVTLGDIQNSQR